MTPEQIADIVSLIIGNNLGVISIFFGLIGAAIWKNTINGIVSGLTFRYSKAYPDEDQVIFILLGDKQTKARISRIGMRTTAFFIYETNSRLIIPNEKLGSLMIQKRLPKE